MPSFTLQEVIGITQAKVVSQDKEKFSDLVSDTRKITEGVLFLAFKGEKFNGEDFAAEALKKGAAGVMVSLGCAEEKIREKEGEALLSKLKPGDYVIAMTIGGKARDSLELSRHIAELRNAGVSRLVFVIGGSLGLGKNILARADEEMSMSRMTFPHQLARVMLLEQLYRTEKILAGERYHK